MYYPKCDKGEEGDKGDKGDIVDKGDRGDNPPERDAWYPILDLPEGLSDVFNLAVQKNWQAEVHVDPVRNNAERPH